MRVSEERIEELRRLYKEAYGKDVSVEEAHTYSIELNYGNHGAIRGCALLPSGAVTRKELTVTSFERRQSESPAK
jgi:hypothetical protein